MTTHRIEPQVETHDAQWSVRLVERAAPFIVVGAAALVITILSSGCAGDLRQRNARLQQEFRRLQAVHEQTRKVIGMKGRMLLKAHGELAATQQRADRLARKVAEQRERMARLQAQFTFYQRKSALARDRGRREALRMCRSLPADRTVKRRLKRELRKPRVVARKRTDRYLLWVAVDHQRRGPRRLVAAFQSKLQRTPTLVTLVTSLPGETDVHARIHPFLNRFVAIRITARQRLDRERDAVAVRYYILRPTTRGAELACVARGSARTESRKTGMSTKARAVRFLPGPRGDGSAFQLEVKEPGLRSVGEPASASAKPVARYLTVSLGDSGKCRIRQAQGRAAPRNALEGLF